MPSAEHEAMIDSMKSQQSGAAPSSIEEVRAGLDSVVSYFEALDFPEDVEESAVDAGGVAGFWFSPRSAPEGSAIVYLHGGGYVMGSVATHRSLIGRLARATGLRCLALDYRLAPEHPFPAAIEDVTAVYHWLLEQGMDASKIMIAGDSAGGGLTLGCLVALRDAGEPMPAGAICLSPLADLELTGASAAGGVDDPMVEREGTLMMAEAYLQGTDPNEPRASPIHADFSGLPPLMIEVGTRELLLDDARRVATKAMGAGVDVTLYEADGLTHVWQMHPHLPESAESLERITHFVKKYLR